MIRQAISCDICGTEKRQANHWFVAYEQSGELRISGWNSPYLSCAGTKHLCGETCLHKLISKFLAKLVDVGTQCTDRINAAMSADAMTMAGAECAEPYVLAPATLAADSRFAQTYPRFASGIGTPVPVAPVRRTEVIMTRTTPVSHHNQTVLSCMWFATGNPSHPIACKWISRHQLDPGSRLETHFPSAVL